MHVTVLGCSIDDPLALANDKDTHQMTFIVLWPLFPNKELGPARADCTNACRERLLSIGENEALPIFQYGTYGFLL